MLYDIPPSVLRKVATMHFGAGLIIKEMTKKEEKISNGPFVVWIGCENYITDKLKNECFVLTFEEECGIEVFHFSP